MNAPIATKKSKVKRCTGPCGMTLPATVEYFNADATTKSGLKSRCRRCRYAAGRLRDSKGLRVCNSRVSPEVYVPGPKPCRLCCSLPWRITGLCCPECGLECATEPRPEMRLRRFDRVG